MALATLINGIHQRLSGRSTSVLLSTEAFQHAAHCERLRVDRNGSTLSILLVELAPGKSGKRDLADLASFLDIRLRLTDTAGHLPDGRIGVLLPDTPESGAWKVAADVCDNYEVGKDRPCCDVLVYPEPGKGDTPVPNGELQDDSGSGLAVGPANKERGDTLFIDQPSLIKRSIDVIGASLGLLLAAPLIVLMGLAIKATSRGGIFYSQEREGLGGRRFRIYKLRTMRHDADRVKHVLRELNEQDGPAFKIKRDPRTTTIGHFLRCTSLDELPQLWNVLKGDMSLVGPRPLPTEESIQCTAWQRQRLRVTPGITCIWQIRGRNVVSFDEWIRMDLRYIRRRSVWYDLFLILQTVPALVVSTRSR
ncbi:MAG: sugar transferase [Aeoliella sp.]